MGSQWSTHNFILCSIAVHARMLCLLLDGQTMNADADEIQVWLTLFVVKNIVIYLNDIFECMIDIEKRICDVQLSVGRV